MYLVRDIFLSFFLSLLSDSRGVRVSFGGAEGFAFRAEIVGVRIVCILFGNVSFDFL